MSSRPCTQGVSRLDGTATFFKKKFLWSCREAARCSAAKSESPLGRVKNCVCYLAGDPEAHTFQNTGRTDDLVIWAFGNRVPHEVCIYPDQGVAFVEGLGAEVPLDQAIPSEWTEERRKH